MIVIGIVGAPAGGKSTVAAHLQAHGATWLDADRLAHRCLAMRQVREKIVSHFGAEVLGPNGHVDRAALGSRVFGADEDHRSELKCLESIVHPPTRQLLYRRLIRSAWRAAPATVLDVPLLFEAGWDVYCDAVWCVDTPLELRLQWLTGRGWTEEQLRDRERRQLSISEKRRLSTDVIVNCGDQGELIAKVEQLWLRFQEGTKCLHGPEKDDRECRDPKRCDPEHCRPTRR